MTSRPTGRVASSVCRVILSRADGGPTDGELLDAYVARRDGAAFAALVRRHGPMVLGVCRRTLRDPHGADDAFQATFLVLVRRAAAVTPRESVGGWLYGVAVRTAAAARRAAARRRARERPVGDAPHPVVGPAGPGDDVGRVLDDELARLPVQYRAAVLLCDVEGMTRQEAARQLGLAVGTVSGRLTAARRTLAARLARRGVTLPAGLATAAVAVPPALAAQTIELVHTAAAPAVAALARRIHLMLLVERLKATAVVVLLVAAVGVCGWAVRAGAAGRADPPDPRPAAAAPVPRGTKTDRLATLEQKLHGRWMGRGFVAVVFTFRADGTFDRSVLNETSTGTWTMTWDALPPTLTTTYAESAPDKAVAGKTYKQKVVQLDDAVFAVENPDGLRPTGYKRVPEPGPGR